MNWTLLFQQIINGIAVGSGYAIFAMGFGLIFANMNILSIAHGTFATWGAIVSLWAVTTLGLPLWVAAVVAVLVIGLLGVTMDQLGFQPLRNRGNAGFFGVLLSSVGFWIILLSLALIATKATIQAFPLGTFPRYFFRFGSFTIPIMQVITFAVALLLMFVLYHFVHRTRTGTAIRAVGFNPNSAALGGVSARQMIIGTSFVAGAICGLAGVLVGVSTNNVSFLLGESLVLKGFAAVVIGGFGDVRGAYLGGLIIGLSEILGAQYVSNSFRDAVAFGLLFLFLLYRPRGVLGTSELALKV